MSSKKSFVVLILLGILSIVVGLALLFISGLKKDQRLMNERIDIIIRDYDKFKTKLESINKERDEIYKEFLETIYYDTFSKNDTAYKNRLYEYEEKITNLSKKNKVLKQYCAKGVYYASSEANSKCNAFNLAYEEMINTFVDDINRYNSNIKKYNKYLDDAGNTDAIRLEKYQTKKNYIDYNQDGEYSGKETKKDE